MSRGSKGPFEKGKIYFSPICDAPIKFVEQTLDAYYVFKIMKDPVWDEFETKVVDDVYANKTAYLRSLKDQ